MAPSLAAALLLSILPALLGGCDHTSANGPVLATRSGLTLDPEPVTRWKLPPALREISGLALTADGRLLAHDDERAIVHELDYRGGRIAKSFAFGRDGVEGDFEGIAVFDGRVALSTSRGELYLGPEGGPDERVEFEFHDPGLERECEFEGLAFDPDARILLLPCKSVDSKKVGLKVVAWSVDRQARQPDRDLVLSRSDLTERIGVSRYQASGIDVDPRTGNRVMISARTPLLLVVSADGESLAALALPAGTMHRQTEGIALAADGTLFLADEGGRGRARLAIYRTTR